MDGNMKKIGVLNYFGNDTRYDHIYNASDPSYSAISNGLKGP